MRKYIVALVALLFTGFAASAQAQTGACPTGLTITIISGTPNICITPDVDYNTLHDPGNGTSVPTVVSLEILVFGPGANTATDAPIMPAINIGKPVRNTQGAVWAPVPQLLTITPGQQYKARVVAIGQPLTAGGAAQVSARSPESNPFIRLAPAPAPRAPLGVSVPAS